MPRQPFIRSVVLRSDAVPSFDEYPFSIPSLRELDELALHPGVTLIAGENGSGKSTLVEAVAVAAGFNAEGSSRNMHFVAEGSQSDVSTHSAILPGYPGAWIDVLGDDGIDRIAYEETGHYELARIFLDDRERFFRHLFSS